MSRVRSILGLLCVLASTGLQADVRPPGELARSLQIVADGNDLRISGLSPGGTLALLGIAREPLAGAASVETWIRSLTDANSDGIAELDLGREVPRKSAWAAVDLATGNFGAARIGSLPLEIVRPGAEGFEIDAESGDPLVRLDRETIQYLLIRPGVGAWSAKAYDGGSGDLGSPEEGVPDGVQRVNPRDFSPLRPEFGEFPGLSAQDWIGAIDERKLTLFILSGADAPSGK